MPNRPDAAAPFQRRTERQRHLGAVPHPRAGGPAGPVPVRDQGLPRRQRVAQRRAGSEYVNHQVAGLLEKLRVEFTRSRPRRSNDNALVESKNASVVRRSLGREHIPAEFAPLVHEFASGVLSPHLNYHRPCLFASESVGEAGKARKVYRDRDAATPCERLKAVAGAERFLKSGVSFAALDVEANAVDDLESTRRVARGRDKLCRAIRGPAQAAAA